MITMEMKIKDNITAQNYLNRSEINYYCFQLKTDDDFLFFIVRS